MSHKTVYALFIATLSISTRSNCKSWVSLEKFRKVATHDRHTDFDKNGRWTNLLQNKTFIFGDLLLLPPLAPAPAAGDEVYSVVEELLHPVPGQGGALQVERGAGLLGQSGAQLRGHEAGQPRARRGGGHCSLT